MVQQLDSEGKVLSEYSTFSEAEQKTGVPATNIVKVTKGKRQSAGGYGWRNKVDDSTTYSQDMENGVLKVETYYKSPPHPDQVIRDHKIDTKKWKLSNFYSKGKAKGWLVTAQFLNLERENEKRLDEEALTRVVKKYIKPLKQIPHPSKQKSSSALRIIITDAHIGMDVSGSVYGTSWGEKELYKRGESIIEAVRKKSHLYKGFDRVELIDLGDYLDGLDGKTVRKIHDLPQNMTNEECFDVGIGFKLFLLDEILKIPANEYKVHNICSDNHAGSFAYFVNSGFKKIVEARYPGVEVNNYNHLFNHYRYGNNVFILSHGKDEKDMKSGMPAKLEPNTARKIDEYAKHYDLYGDGVTVTFEKGDSHQQILDQTTSTDFFYHSYMAFSPASAYVTKNYSKGRSGFNLMVVDKETGQQDITPIYF